MRELIFNCDMTEALKYRIIGARNWKYSREQILYVADILVFRRKLLSELIFNCDMPGALKY